MWKYAILALLALVAIWSDGGGNPFGVSFGGVSNAAHYALVLFVLIAALIVLPWAFRAYGHVLGLPGRIIAGVWNRAVGLFTPAPISRLISRITPRGLDAWLQKRTAGSKSLLLQGERMAFAERRWSRARYPFLYEDVPADVRRSVVWDGRVIGGYNVTWLGWRHITAEVVADLAKTAGRIGLRAGAITALLTVAVVILEMVFGGYRAPVPYPAWSEGLDLMPRVDWYALVAVDLAMRSGLNLVLALLGAACLTPCVMFGAFWRGVHAWWTQATEALATPTRDSLVIYRHKADKRETDIAAYARQVELALAGQKAGLPLLQLGTATGIARARGDMHGPQAGKPVCLDGISIRQHVIAFGGTGEGKTADFILPMAAAVFGADWGTGHQIGGYITDGKGVLYQDILELPAIKARDDVRVLGTGPDHFGVNLIDGMTPLELSSLMTTITSQVMGDEGEFFWTEQASTIFFHAATLAQILDLDPDTVNDQEWASFRPWSLMGIGRLATDQRATDAAVKRILELGDTPISQLPPEMAPLIAGSEIVTTVQYLRGTWATMASDTKSGIVANVNVLVGKFGGAGMLRDRFCTGRLPADQVVDVDHALNGGIVAVAVGESDWGTVGKVVACWLKTRLYIAARKRQKVDPEGCKKTSVAIFADEFQMLATSGGAESDAEFYNVARSTGCFLIAATQSLAALQQRLGEKVTENLLNNLRTKVCLRLEDMKTLEMMSSLAGKTLRGFVVEEDFYETQGQREIERPDVAPAPDLSEAVSLKRILPTTPSLDTPRLRDVVRLDSRFMQRGGLGGSDIGELGTQQAAFWRQEDREKEAKGAGLQDKPLFEPTDLLTGGGFAFALVQRAGNYSVDLIDLRKRAA